MASTGTQTESALPPVSTSTWTAADLDAMEQQAAEQTKQVEQIDKQASLQTGRQIEQQIGKQTKQQAGHQVEQTNAQTAEQASKQAVKQQEQANGDIPATSPKLENVENVGTDLQNDSDVYTETWEENGYKFRYTDLTRRANGRAKQQANEQAEDQMKMQTDGKISRQTVKLQEQANGDIPVVSPRLENIENIEEIANANSVWQEATRAVVVGGLTRT